MREPRRAEDERWWGPAREEGTSRAHFPKTRPQRPDCTRMTARLDPRSRSSHSRSETKTLQDDEAADFQDTRLCSERSICSFVCPPFPSPTARLRLVRLRSLSSALSLLGGPLDVLLEVEPDRKKRERRGHGQHARSRSLGRKMVGRGLLTWGPQGRRWVRLEQERQHKREKVSTAVAHTDDGRCTRQARRGTEHRSESLRKGGRRCEVGRLLPARRTARQSFCAPAGTSGPRPHSKRPWPTLASQPVSLVVRADAGGLPLTELVLW